MKQRGGTGGPEGRKTQRDEETKNEKWTKTTEPISPSNKHSSWTSFSDRQQWRGGGKNKGSSGNKELIKNSKKKKVKLPDWSKKERKTKQLHELYTGTTMRQRAIQRASEGNNQSAAKTLQGAEGEVKVLSHWLCILFNIGFSYCLSYCM